MAKSSYLQTSFLGGSWAPEVQGRSDVDNYKTALNICENYYPIEQASLIRRQGTQFIGYTKAGAPARYVGFDFSGKPYQFEFSDSWVRVILGETFLDNGTAAVASISGATPAVVTCTGAHGFSTNDTLWFSSPASPAPQSPLFNRQFVLTSTGANTFTLVDAVTGLGLDGSTVPGFTSGGYVVHRIAELSTPYINGDWANCTFLQDETKLLIFHPKYATRTLFTQLTGFGLGIGIYDYSDGPYLDVNTSTTTITPSGSSGSVNLTLSSATGVNSNQGWLTTDVGRHVRMFFAPAAWLVGSTYVVGDQVQYVDGNSYVAIKNNSAGIVPTNIDHWALLAFLPYWTWAKITARTNATVAVATIQQSTQSTSNSTFNVLATKIWQLGLFGDTLGWPTVGAYHENRLWTSGVVVNRFDATMSNQYAIMSPTGDDGTVSDANAVAITVKANENNPTVWISADDQGLLYGTLKSEWKVRASTLDDPITPSSVQARRLSANGSAVGTQPVFTTRMHVFIQRMQRKLMEIGHPSESGALYTPNSITNLSLTGGHLSITGLAELAYCQEPKSMLWARRNDGVLLGLSYMRDADKLTAGWSEHVLGHGRKTVSLSSGPSLDLLSDRLFLVTKDANGVHWGEMLTDVFDDNLQDWDAWFVDAGVEAIYNSFTALDGIRCYGFTPMAGKTVSGSFGGLDMGDAVVSASGYVDFPFHGAFTHAYTTARQAQAGRPMFPVVGFGYTSRGQLLRPDHGGDAGSRNGPAFGKKRRNHWFAALLNRTRDISIGTDFASLIPIKIQTARGVDVAADALFSGVVTDTVKDDYTFEGQLAWAQTRPVPGQVLAVSGFIETMDK